MAAQAARSLSNITRDGTPCPGQGLDSRGGQRFQERQGSCKKYCLFPVRSLGVFLLLDCFGGVVQLPGTIRDVNTVSLQFRYRSLLALPAYFPSGYWRYIDRICPVNQLPCVGRKSVRVCRKIEKSTGVPTARQGRFFDFLLTNTIYSIIFGINANSH